jgi:NDP-sugar pyrophosphorylase family protein
LIPIGDKPIIEIIIDEFKKQGVSEFYTTLNHKGEMIESYFNSIEKDYKISYVREKTFLGTAGSLKLLDGKIGDLFIVSNYGHFIFAVNFLIIIAIIFLV